MTAARTSFADVKACYKRRSPYSRKGDNGRVLVVGGSDDFSGAPALAAMGALAALRTGADLAVIAAPEKAGWAMSEYSPDVIVKKFRGRVFAPAHAAKIAKLSQGFDSVLIGPGLGTAPPTFSFCRALAGKVKQPMVADADALKALAGTRFSGRTIITPHSGEFEIFARTKLPPPAAVSARAVLVKRAAKKHGCTILLKGHADIISDGARVKLNRTGNAGMAKGGTGDVLAGICAALLALHNAPFEAACAAAYINGRAGDILLRKKGYGFIAGDLPQAIPEVIKKLR
ncbi:MAG: NAD(P)H-hydrate dehydratase [Candidatus Diapherotrites archaeon]